MPDPRTRLIVDAIPPAGSRIRLPAAEASHVRARRLRVGEPVFLVDGSGSEARARVAALGGGRVELVVESLVEAAAPQGPEITLLVGGVRPERLSWLVEKATELGVRRIGLVRSARTQSFRASEAVVSRLERVARAAAKQSEQQRWPEIAGPASFAAALTQASAERFLLDLEGDQLPSRLDAAAATILVGPEGGWTPDEREAARRARWRPARLPAGKLRTETAAVAAVVLLRAAMTKGEP